MKVNVYIHGHVNSRRAVESTVRLTSCYRVANNLPAPNNGELHVPRISKKRAPDYACSMPPNTCSRSEICLTEALAGVLRRSTEDMRDRLLRGSTVHPMRRANMLRCTTFACAQLCENGVVVVQRAFILALRFWEMLSSTSRGRQG